MSDGINRVKLLIRAIIKTELRGGSSHDSKEESSDYS